MSQSNLTPEAAAAFKAFARSWTWRLALAFDIAGVAIGATGYYFTHSLLAFAPLAVAASYLVFVLVRFKQSQAASAVGLSRNDETIVR